jgi:hypothetical protein
MSTRYEIGPHYDRWMMGDRYGQLVKVTKASKGDHKGREIAHLRMEASGKTLKFWLDECEVRG